MRNADTVWIQSICTGKKEFLFVEIIVKKENMQVVILIHPSEYRLI